MHPYMALLGGDTWKLVPDFSWSLFHVPFPFADSNLCPFIVTK